VTTVASPVFVDTNVLIYAHSALAPLHAVAFAALQDLAAAGTELVISRQTLREYLAGMTRPGLFTGMLPMPTLIADVQIIEAQFRVVEDGPAVTAQLLALLTRVTAGGKQVHDANVVATMLAHGIPNLLTNNVADFARFGAYITVVPLVPPAPPAPPPAAPAPPPPPGGP